MKKAVKVSIITVCYNSRNYIQQTIESVLNQTYSDIEYIIVDGGSTDGTLDIIRQYEERFSGRMRWISEPDRGIYDAMNKGIDRASGELIGIINSDDYYEPDAVENAVEAYEEHQPYQIIYGMVRVMENGHEKQVYLNRHEMVESAALAHPACFLSKKLYCDKGKYSLHYRIVSDWELFLRIRNDRDILYKPVYKILANFRTGGASGNVADTSVENMRLKREYGLCSGRAYFCVRVKWALYKLLHI